MIYFLIIFLIVCLVAAVFGLSLIIGLIQTRGVPFISTPKKYFTEIIVAAKLTPENVFCDFGCGKAHLLIRAAKETGCRGIGYELSLWPYVLAKIKIFLAGVPVKIFFKNFFKADLREVDVVFCYLFPEIMAQLENKFKKEMPAGSRVVAYDFKLPSLVPQDVIKIDGRERIFVYKF